MERISRLIVVQGGSVYRASGTSLQLVTNGASALRSDVAVSSAPAFGKLYFADGAQYVVYDGWADSVSAWTASAGSMPVDSDGNPGRLVALYRGRVVISGLYGDPHNWFMSAVDNPRDFDYSPATVTEAVAVAGNNSVVGLVGDVITALATLDDDVLLFGGDHTVYAMVGDPAAGGRIDLVTDVTGMAWNAWAKDPQGAVWFFGMRGGVYRIAGRQVESMSGAIENLLRSVDTSATTINLVWDDRSVGMHLFLTPSNGSAGSHYFYDARRGAWLRDSYPNGMQPTAVHAFDGDDPNDRAVLLGGYDGNVRKFDLAADDDDGTAINSYVLLGPIQVGNRHTMISDIRAVLASGSNDVTYEILYGDSAEAALASTAKVTGTFSAGRNNNEIVRESAQAMFIKIANTTLDQKWAIERIQAVLKPMGASTHRYQ